MVSLKQSDRLSAARMLTGLLVGLMLPTGSAGAAHVVLGSNVGDKVQLQINRKSPDPAKHQVKFATKDPGLAFTPGGGAVDDPLANGATALVFGGSDCQCIPLPPAGWTASPKSGTPKTYKWKDAVTKSAAQVAAGKV